MLELPSAAAKLRPALLAGVSALALLVAQTHDAAAGLGCVPSQQNIIASTSSGISYDGGGIAISPGVVVNPAGSGISGYCDATTISNAGTIDSGTGIVLDVGRQIGLVSNAGAALINGSDYGISITGGTIGTLRNAGAITGLSGGLVLQGFGSSSSIVNYASIGTLTNTGTIASTGRGGGTFAAGVGLFGANIGTLNNAGVIGYVGTVGSPNSNGVINIFSTIGLLNNTGTIGGATIAVANLGAAAGAFAPTITGATIGSMVNSGLIQAEGFGVLNAALGGSGGGSGQRFSGGFTSAANTDAAASIGALTNTGTISATFGVANIALGGGTFGTSPSIIGPSTTGSIAVAKIGTLTNTGLIEGPQPIANWALNPGTLTRRLPNPVMASIDAIVNTGTITSVGRGGGTLGAISNMAFNPDFGGSLGNFPGAASAQIGIIVNAGTISGSIGIANLAFGGTQGRFPPNFTMATIGAIINTGVIAGAGIGILNVAASSSRYATSSASIGQLTNTGTISGGRTGIANYYGAIGAISNSGLISGGSYAIRSQGGGLGVITNTGTIQGGMDVSDQNLTIVGGSGNNFGVLRGGDIVVGNGDLIFASGNQLLASDVVVGGSVVNQGNLMVASPVNISGNFQQGAGANLIIGIANATPGKLIVTGSADMTNSGVIIQALGGYRLPGTNRLTIVDGGTGSTYTGVTVSSTNYQVSGVATDTTTMPGHINLVLTLSPISYTTGGNNSGRGGGGMGGTLDQIATGTTPEAVAFQNAVLNAIDAQGQNRQSGVRQTAPYQGNPHNINFQLIGSAITKLLEGRQLGLFASATGGGAGVAAGETANGMQMWMQAMGGVASRSTTATVDGYSTSYGGMMVGLDWNLQPGLTVGAGVSQIQAYSDMRGLTSGGKVRLDSTQLTAHVVYSVTPELFAYGQIGAAINQMQQTRAINFLNARARASYDGNVLQAKGGLGYDVALSERLTLTPLAGLHFIRSNNDSYTESGAGPANLRVRASTANAVTHDVGARIVSRYQTSFGEVAPELRLAWTHDYVQGGIATTGMLAGTAFFSRSPRVAPDGARLNVGATLAHINGVQFRAGYEGDLRSNYQSHTGLVRATLSF